MAYHVVARVAQHRRHEDHEHEPAYLEGHARQRRDGPCHEEQRVAGQEGCHHEPRLAEDDDKQYGIRPLVIVLHELHHVLVDVQDKVNNKLNELHFLIYYRKKQTMFGNATALAWHF